MKLPFGFSFEADFSGDGYLFLVLLFVGSAFAILMNKPRKNGPSRMDYWKNWIIPAVRILALLSLLFLLFEPELVLSRQYSIPKRIAVVIDQSSSMGKAWKGNSEDLHKSIHQTIGELEKTSKLDIWTMEGGVLSLDKLDFEEDMSIFSWNPYDVYGPERTDMYSAVFLFSDGHLNGGRSPLDIEWSKTLDVNIVYPLKPKSSASLKLIAVNQLNMAGADQEVMIRCSLHQDGLFGRRAIVQVLTDTNQLLVEENIQLNQTFQDIDLTFRGGNAASGVLTLKLFLEGGTYLTEQIIEIKQDQDQTNVLIVSERINDLHKFLAQSFSGSTFNVQIVHGTHRMGDQLRISINLEELDLIILNHPGELAQEILSKTSLDINTFSSTPTILFYEGIEQLSSMWVEWLGVKVASGSENSAPQTSFWTDSSMEHAFYLGLLGRGYNPNDLMKYAPVSNPNYNIINEGDAMLTIGNGSSATSIFSLIDHPPRAIFSGNGFWKWFFHPQSKASFEILWSYLLIYLEEIAHFNPVQIDIPVESAGTGTYLKAAVTIKDLDNRIIRAAELRVWQEDRQGNQSTLNLSRDESGVYRTELDTKNPGEILIIAEAYRFGELWGRDTSRIHLMSFSGEDQSRGVNEVFLSRLASRSGGEVIQIGQDELPIIPNEMIQLETSIKYSGVRSPLIFTVLVMLLTFEWIWRRRNGLL